MGILSLVGVLKARGCAAILPGQGLNTYGMSFWVTNVSCNPLNLLALCEFFVWWVFVRHVVVPSFWRGEGWVHRVHYGPILGPSMGHDGPKLAQKCCERHVLNSKMLRTPCSKIQKVANGPFEIPKCCERHVLISKMLRTARSKL